MLMSPAAERPHVPSLSRLWPAEVIVPEQSLAPLLATIVFVKMALADWKLWMPPAPALAPVAEFPLMVLLLRVKMADWKVRMPPALAPRRVRRCRSLTRGFVRPLVVQQWILPRIRVHSGAC